jgi:hypothetical protein
MNIIYYGAKLNLPGLLIPDSAKEIGEHVSGFHLQDLMNIVTIKKQKR